MCEVWTPIPAQIQAQKARSLNVNLRHHTSPLKSEQWPEGNKSACFSRYRVSETSVFPYVLGYCDRFSAWTISTDAEDPCSDSWMLVSDRYYGYSALESTGWKLRHDFNGLVDEEIHIRCTACQTESHCNNQGTCVRDRESSL
mmetsp:Transcript_26957/g.42112  ORF Transcript_26957/g.42112 Transcript_26957/m.42112 type:complete len:143 (+) Transcript_26957:704-1132(+)